MKAGEIRPIYSDPVTKKDFEGHAKLITKQKAEQGDERGERWGVRFCGGDQAEEPTVLRWVDTGDLYEVKIINKTVGTHTEQGAISIMKKLERMGIRALAQRDSRDGKNQMRTIMTSDGEKKTWNKRETHKGAR